MEEKFGNVERKDSSLLQNSGVIIQKYRLYETRSKFYMVGRDKSRTHWKVLKIERSESSELNISEDPTIYTAIECSDLLKRVHEGNKATGGLMFITACYGIVGFIKFLGPYYMILITKRRVIGTICGHNIYAISKSATIPLANPAVRSNMVNSRIENRYKKLLCMVDLTKDFYFSYSYNVMRSLQKNMLDSKTGLDLYETMFVWNEYLTRGFRNILQNTTWTVPLVYGFFEQAAYSISGRVAKVTLIGRRSRHYAGTRYLRRGVNEMGRVANDVETEQIVVEDVAEGEPMRISSVVQNRGSIPLFWSQETSRLNIKPDIVLSKRDQTYEATRLHFENLATRYGRPIIILNLIKTNEKRPRESILRTEFANAIEVINKDLTEENRLKFLHLDLNKHSRSKATNVLILLWKVAADALSLTGFFCSEVTPPLLSQSQRKSHSYEDVSDKFSPTNCNTDEEKHNSNEDEDSDNSERKSGEGNSSNNSNPSAKPPLIQNGVLRTNCIDCLDRTNVAQFAYGWAALGRQLLALRIIESAKLDLEDALVEELMSCYERMGDTLAHQYGGSAAHNKIFSQRRGQWKAATQSQEFFRTLQRYYSNAYIDADKQNAINVFLGHFQPQPGKPDVWELDVNQHYDVGRNVQTNDENERSLFKRSWSENILPASPSATAASSVHKGFPSADFHSDSKVGKKILSESTPDMSTSDNELAYSRYTHSKAFSADIHRERFLEHDNGGGNDCSNFVDVDLLSSAGNSCEEELFERSLLLASPAVLSSENLVSELVADATPSSSECGSSAKGGQHTGTDITCVEAHNDVFVDNLSDRFVQWVMHGEALCH